MKQSILVPFDKLPESFSSAGQTTFNQCLVGCLVHDDLKLRRKPTIESSQGIAGSPDLGRQPVWKTALNRFQPKSVAPTAGIQSISRNGEPHPYYKPHTIANPADPRPPQEVCPRRMVGRESVGCSRVECHPVSNARATHLF